MPKAAFCGPPHSESEVYYAKATAIEPEPLSGYFLSLLLSSVGSSLLPRR